MNIKLIAVNSGESGSAMPKKLSNSSAVSSILSRGETFQVERTAMPAFMRYFRYFSAGAIFTAAAVQLFFYASAPSDELIIFALSGLGGLLVALAARKFASLP